MGLETGIDYIDGSIGGFQQQNRLKNHWRGSAAPSSIQPGMIFSDSDNDKLYHRGAAAEEEILQLTRSQDVSPTFLYETLLGRNLKCWWNFEDFIGPVNTSAYVNPGIWQPIVSGAGATIVDIDGEALRPGILMLNTGTTNVGTAAIITGSNSYSHIMFSAGVYTIESDIYIPVLSTAAEQYTLRFGFGQSAIGDEIDGAYFEYTDIGGGGSTPNWYKCTANAAARTKTNTGVAAVAGAWTRLKIVVNATATSVEYFINEISVGVETTNIPAARVTGCVLSIIKSAGIIDRVVNIDWTWVHINLTTTR
jgi:hypothetical protein